MNFRSTTLVSKGLIYIGGFAVLMPVVYLHPLALLGVILWLFQRPQIIHRYIFPFIFTHVRCKNGRCAYLIPLVQTFQMETFKGNRPTSIWCVRDDRGREVGTLDCPKCSTTIPIQKARPCKLVRATVIGNAFASAPSEKKPRKWSRRFHSMARINSETPFPVGFNREDMPTFLQRLWRRIAKQSRRRSVDIYPDVYRRHEVYFGGSGMGKSTLLEAKAQWIMENGMGMTVIDPSGLLINNILRLVPAHRKDDVILIRASDRECPFQLNPLESRDEMAKLNMTGELLRTIKSVSGSWGEDIAYNLERAIETACLLNGSLRDAYELLAKQSVRDRVVPQIDDEELLDFWSGWDLMKPRSKTPTIRKLRAMMKHPILGPMLGAAESNYDPEAAIRESKIVLVDLNSKSDTKEVIINLGTIMIGKTRAAAVRQEHGEETQHFLMIDEARNFMYPGMDLATILSEARKKKLSLTLATQHVKQLEDIIEEIYGNAGTLIAFSVDKTDAKQLADRMTDVDFAEIMQQDVGECTGKVHRTTYRIKTRLPKKPAVDFTTYVEGRMRELNQSLKHDDETGEGSDIELDLATIASRMVCERVQ